MGVPTEPETSNWKLSIGDSIGMGALVIALIAYAVTPPIWLRAVLLIASAAGFFVFCRKSHWTQPWKPRRQVILATVATLILGCIGVPQLLNQWKEEPKPTPALPQPKSDIDKETGLQQPQSQVTPSQKVSGMPEQDDAKKPKLSTRKRTPSTILDNRQPSVIIQTAPSFGNIRERAITLSDNIMQDLYLHGWPSRGPGNPLRFPFVAVEKFPGPGAIREDWEKRRSRSFRHEFLPQVLNLANEFIQLHVRDDRLEETLRRELAIANEHKQEEIPLSPMIIEEIANQLKIFASQISR